MTVKKKSQSASHISWSSMDLLTERDLPGDLFLCLRHRLVRYRSSGDKLTTAEFDRFVYNRVETIFIARADELKFAKWLTDYSAQERQEVVGDAPNADQKPILESTLDLRRAALDLFSAPQSTEVMRESLDSSKRMVTEFLKKPYIVDNITSLQRYGRGCVDHSVNVSVLSVFLGVQMGFTSQSILENLALGGLMHDLGKAYLPPSSDDSLLDENDPEYRRHPLYGAEALAKQGYLPEEVRMIVEQHHEYADGSGYPKGLQGLGIYELTRIVAIANVYDNLVSGHPGSMQERQREALEHLEKDYVGRLDRKKVEKAVKILSKSIAS